MPYSLYDGDDADQRAKGAFLMALFSSARMQRVNFESQWEEAASLAWPEYRNSFSWGHVRAPGAKYAQYQVDSTAAVKAWRFMCIADMMLTPFNMLWSGVSADNDYLLKQRGARLYFDQWTDVLWAERYRPIANFHSQQQLGWHQLCVFGNHYMLCDRLETQGGERQGLRYMECSVGEIYRLVNHQGRTDGYIRHFRWTASMAAKRWKDKIAGDLLSALHRADELTLFDFMEFVLPRKNYNPYMPFSTRGKPWSSTYFSPIGHAILEEGGYDSFPLAAGGYALAPEEWYYRGPAQMILAELKTKNSQKEAALRTAVEAGNPIRLLPEDGLFDFKATAGNTVFGGMTDDGRPLIANLPTGNYQVTVEAMGESDKLIDAMNLIDLFPVLFGKEGDRQRSAREVVEIANQAAMFLAPALGGQFGYLGDLIAREMRVIQQLGYAPPMPGVVREARGEFKIKYTGPLGLAIHGHKIAGFWRTHEMLTQAAQMTGDPSIVDVLDYDAAAPEIAEWQHVPVRWTASQEAIARKRQGRARQAQQENYVRSLPGLAARDKAQAIVAKAQTGGNIGGTLSGTAPGGMPILPAAARGQPGRPGMSGIGAR